MSRLTELLRRVEQRDPALAKELTQEVKALENRRAFGLNFERHTPESVELPERIVRRGDKVRFRVPRGESTKGLDDRIWLVTSFVSRAEPSRAEPSRAEPSRAEPSRAEPSRGTYCPPD